MIIYLSMILWVPLIYYIYSQGHRETINLENASTEELVLNRVPIAYAIVVFGYFIFWIGIRKMVADTPQYISSFNSIPSDFSAAWEKIDWSGGNKGPLFFTIESIFKCYITNDVTWFLMTVAIVCGVSVMVTLRKYSVDYFYSCYLFITLCIFTWMMNGMRQFIAVSLLFLCSDFIIEGKWAKYFIVTFILSYIHLTCLIMIPVYFISRAKPWKTKTAMFMVAILLISIFAEPFFSGVDEVLSNTSYSGAISQFAEDDGVNPLRLLFYLIPVIISFINRRNLEKYYEKIPILPICINMSLVTCGFYFVGIFTSGILVGRIPIYCEIYNLIFIPILLNISFKNNSTIIKFLYAVLTLVYFYFIWGGTNYHSDFTGGIA